MSLLAWALLLALSCLWGSSYFVIEIALRDLPVMTIVAFRLVLAALVLWLVVAATGNAGKVPRSLRAWGVFAIMGLLNNVAPFLLIVWGQTEITSSLASILNATTPIFAVVVAALVLRDEPITRLRVVAVLIGFAGVIVMVGPDALHDLGRNVLAQFAVVLAGLSYACASVYGRRYLAAGVPPSVNSACQVSMSACMLLPFAIAEGGIAELAAATPSSWAALLSLAVLSTALAYLLYFRLLATAGATNLMLVTFLIPVTAILLGTTLLGEVLHTSEIGGMLLIALALVVIDGRVFRRRRSPPVSRPRST